MSWPAPRRLSIAPGREQHLAWRIAAVPFPPSRELQRAAWHSQPRTPAGAAAGRAAEDREARSANMTRSGLIRRLVAANPHLHLRDLERIVATVFEQIGSALGRGDRVELRGFGMFSTRGRGGRVGRNPRTGAEVAVPGKAVPRFKVGKELAERLNLCDAPTAEPGLRGVSGVGQADRVSP